MKMEEAYGPLAGGLLLFFFLFIGVNILITRRCRTVYLKTDEINNEAEPSDNNSNGSPLHLNVSFQQMEIDMSVYETINENEMLPYFIRVRPENDQEETSSTNSLPCSSPSSTSDQSYLEVIDDNAYINPYATISSNIDVNDQHLYCTISDQFDPNQDADHLPQNINVGLSLNDETNKSSEKKSLMSLTTIDSNLQECHTSDIDSA
ncbi:unnamed protein product [Mytilus coruscus]|uniref:Uncharacterized protein n=1 Tax=Mytilus coruscus TaxID=42192 RepID=A0A6J8B4P8_MYTCO|nr:unnamed protein product [Mytilus coruscus]